MVQRGREVFQEQINDDQECLEIMEISLNNLREGEAFDTADYLARIDLLNKLGRTVMVSNRSQFHSLAAHLRRNTKKKIGLVLGAPLLKEIFDEKYYDGLEGGLLEASGRLFKRDLTLFVYPVLNPETGVVETARTITIQEKFQYLLTYLLHTKAIQALEMEEIAMQGDQQGEIAAAVSAGKTGWERWVPELVAQTIKDQGYFGWPK
jgi:hypothetical protein